jgi:hypothetical protein
MDRMCRQYSEVVGMWRNDQLSNIFCDWGFDGLE